MHVPLLPSSIIWY